MRQQPSTDQNPDIIMLNYVIDKLTDSQEKYLTVLQQIRTILDKTKDDHSDLRDKIAEIINSNSKIIEDTGDIQNVLKITTNKELLEKVSTHLKELDSKIDSKSKDVIGEISKFNNFYKLVLKLIGLLGAFLLVGQILGTLIFGKVNIEELATKIEKKIEKRKK